MIAGIRRRHRFTAWLAAISLLVQTVIPPGLPTRVVADESGPLRVPAVVGLTAAEAKRELEAVGLTPSLQLGRAAPSEFQRLTVYQTTPAGGTAASRGDAVSLLIYADQVDAASSPQGGVPSVIGLTVAEAKAALTAAGLEPALSLGVPPDDAARRLRVYTQSPPAGSATPADRSVQIIFYAPDAAPTGAVAPGTALAAVHAQPFVDDRTQSVRSRDGELAIEQLDLTVPAGILTLEVRRFLRLDDDDQPGLFGKQWRLGWEKRVVHRNGQAALRERSGWLAFRPLKTPGSFISPQGDRLTIDTSSAQCLRADDTRETYDAAGRLVEVDARNGNVIRLEYDTAGRLNRIAGPFGSYLSLVTDNDGRLVQVSGSNGATVRYFYGSAADAPPEANVRFGYDAAGKLNAVEFPGEGRTEFTRDARGRVTSRRFADGTQERWEYDDAAGVQRHIDALGAISTTRQADDGRTVELTSALGHRSRIETDEFQRPVVITAADGLTARVTYDELGRLTSVTRGDEAPQTYAYHADTHVLTSRTERDGVRIVRQHDLQHNLLSIAHERDDDKDARFDYLPNGLLKRSERRGEQAFKLEYDDHGRIARLIDSAGNAGSFEYDQHGRLLRFVDPEGKSTSNDYDRDGRLTSSTDASGATSRYEYDDTGRLVRAVDPAGGAETYEYDARGRRTVRTDALGRTFRRTYDAAGRLTAVTDPTGAVTKYEYDAEGNRVRTVNPLGGATSAQYDAVGRVVSERDASGGTTRFEYSSTGQLLRRTESDGANTTFEYDDAGRIVAEIDRYGQTTRHEYDLHGNPTRTTRPGGTVVERRYDETDQLIAVLEDGKPTVRYEYDKLGNRTRETYASGREVTNEYDALGRLTAWRDNLGGSGSTRYDIDGRPLELTDATGAKVRYRYDLAGNLLGLTDALGNAERRTYDAVGQLTVLTDPNGGQVRYEYDAAGRVSKLIRPAGGENVYQYDALGNPLEATDPSGRTVHTQYDQAGRLISSTDGRGQATTYVYDAADRLLEKRSADGRVTTYRYDVAGKLEEVDDGEFPVLYRYDDRGRRTQIEYPAIRQTLEYRYDDRNRVTSLTRSGGREVQYRYDDFDRVTTIDAGRGAIRFEYDGYGRRKAIDYPNGVRCTHEFDSVGRVTHITYADRDGKKLADWSYKYDDDGNLVEAVDGDGVKTAYRYDAAGQLVEERRGEAVVAKYAYDADGNRRQAEFDGRKVEYRHDAADRLTAAGEETLKYDDEGNLVERTGPMRTTRYTFDDENRLTKVDLPDGAAVRYGYAPTGERIWREADGRRTWYVTDGAEVLAELDGEFNATTTYVQGPGLDHVLAATRGDETEYLHPDHRGCIRLATDSVGGAASERDYDAFGRVVASRGDAPTAFSFTGRELDAATGLYYYRARYYDAELGRFLSYDPHPGRQSQTLSLNPYLYAFNNPVRYVDPWGAAGESWTYGGQGTEHGSNSVSRFAYEARYWRGDPAGLQSYIDAAKQMQQLYPNDPKVADILTAADQRMAEIARGGSNAPIIKTPAAPPTPPTSTAPVGSAPSSAGGTMPSGASPSAAAGTIPGGSAPASATGTMPTNAAPAAATGTRPLGTGPSSSSGTIPGGSAPPASAAAAAENGFTYNRMNVPVPQSPPGFGSQVWNNVKNSVQNPLGRALTGIGVAVVIYRTATAAPGQRLVTFTRGSGGVAGGIIGGAVATALVSNPGGWVLLGLGLTGGVIGGFIGDQVGLGIGNLGNNLSDLVNDPTTSDPPRYLGPDHPTTGNVADNPLFQRQQQSLQNAQPPPNTTAGTTTPVGSDRMQALPPPASTAATTGASTTGATLPSLPALPKPAPPPSTTAGTSPHPDHPQPTEPAKPAAPVVDYSGSYKWQPGIYARVATKFTWKQLGPDSASVTFHMDGQLSQQIAPHMPATCVGTVRRSGDTYVMVGDPFGQTMTTGVNSFEKAKGNPNTFKYTMIMRFTPVGGGIRVSMDATASDPGGTGNFTTVAARQ